MYTGLNSRLPVGSVKNRSLFNRAVAAYLTSTPTAKYGLIVPPGASSGAVRIGSTEWTNLKTNNTGPFIEFLQFSLYVQVGNTVCGVFHASGLLVAGNRVLSFPSAVNGTTADTFVCRGASAAQIQLGNADAAAPVAQTLSVQSVVAGTSNTNGTIWTLKDSAGTGTGTSGGFDFQVAPAGSTGTTQNTYVSALTIDSTKRVTFSGSIVSNGTNIYNRASAANYWFGTTDDTVIGRKSAARIRFGDSDASVPVAQTTTVQSVIAGTSNTAGSNWTIAGSQGTGTGVGGDIIFQTAPAGSSGSTQNTSTTALTIKGDTSLVISYNQYGQLGTAAGVVVSLPRSYSAIYNG